MAGISIASNNAAASAQRQFGRSSRELHDALTRLSSGMRINHAKDDAAGLAVAESLRVDARVYAQAVRNINDGISYLNIAEGVVGELKAIVLRQRELAAQAASGTLGGQQRQALDCEVQALSDEYNRVIKSGVFNGINPLSYAQPSVSVQAGYGAGETLAVQLAETPDGTALTSLGDGGSVGDFNSYRASMSGDGRFVSFTSSASNLVVDDSNGTQDIFIRDTLAGDTIRVSVSSGGSEAHGVSGYSRLSEDGRYVVFQSTATDLISGDNNGKTDIFLHDTSTSQTTRISVASDGTEATGDSFRPVISADGRYVAFYSNAANLVDGDTNGKYDVFVHDTLTGQTTRASVSSTGIEGDNDSRYLSISSDGRYVAFQSTSTNLVFDDTNAAADIFVHDNITGETTRVNVASDGSQAIGGSTSNNPAISGDGRYVAFESSAGNLVAGDTDGVADIFVRDILTGATQCVSLTSDGMQGAAASTDASISSDGRYVAFESDLLVADDVNGWEDIFVRDLLTNETRLVSVSRDGQQVSGSSSTASISGDGRYVTFDNLEAMDYRYATSWIDVYTGDNPAALDYTVPLAFGLSVASQALALHAQGVLDSRLEQLNSFSAVIGANMNRLEAANKNTTVKLEGTKEAHSRIIDADAAEESAHLVKSRILQQSGALILAQANNEPRIALRLLNSV